MPWAVVKLALEMRLFPIVIYPMIDPPGFLLYRLPPRPFGYIEPIPLLMYCILVYRNPELNK